MERDKESTPARLLHNSSLVGRDRIASINPLAPALH